MPTRCPPAHGAALRCAHSRLPPNRASAPSGQRNAAGQLVFANHGQRPLSLASNLPLGRQGGREEEGEEGLGVWEVREVLQDLWMAQSAAVGSHGPDLPQAEWQAKVRGPLSPESPEVPRCSGKNPVGGSCPEPSSQALPHTKPPVSIELPSVSIANTPLHVKVR